MGYGGVFLLDVLLDLLPLIDPDECPGQKTRAVAVGMYRLILLLALSSERSSDERSLKP